MFEQNKVPGRERDCSGGGLADERIRQETDSLATA